MNNKKLPKRKQLILKNFDYSQNNAFFITICIHNRNRLLGEVKETSVGATLCGRPNYPHKMIEKWLFEIQNKYLNTKIDYYVIMPDHIHFILFIEGDHTGSPLQDIIGWFKTMTTNDYIKGVKNKLYELKVMPLFSFIKASPSVLMTFCIEVEPSVETEPVSSLG